MGKRNGSIFTFVNDSIRDIRFIYGEVNDKLQFIILQRTIMMIQMMMLYFTGLTQQFVL